MKIEQKRVVKVLERMIDLVKDDEDYAQMFAEELDITLDYFLGCDSFGTEGQQDPRGDARDGAFSMLHVQGVD